MNKQLLAERAGLYSLLHHLYSYPLTKSLLLAVSDLSTPPDSALTAGLEKMQTSLHRYNSLPAAVEALNIEMTRLMEGPGLTPAPPYASYYLNHRQLMGPSAAQARAFYLQWQAVPDAEFHLPDDHIALELGFMAHLANLAANAPADPMSVLAASRDFLQEHLLPWLPHFAQALRTADKNGFFAGLAEFTTAVVQEDLGWLESVALAPSTADTGAGRSSFISIT